MNIGTIADMIRADPNITKDVPAFLKRMNVKDIRRVEKVTTIVEEVETFVSIADIQGGEATERDVKEAVNLLASEPLLKEAQERLDKVKAAIASGDVADEAAIIAKFSEAK